MAKTGTFVLRKNAKGEYVLIPKHLAPPLNAGQKPGYAVIRDDLGQPLKHMGNGKVTESKSVFRRWTKESGCIEIGNDVKRSVDPLKIPLPDVRQDLAQHWDRLGLK